ncbi:acetyltransferase [Litorimonas cladophorae]|uniref:Acetyltransferase n=1 Tax=Litorimonas cladophorae TaxID=1220491 RepID=A0A918KHQ1_9PROT|nr:GNAT family N-acetyltransferase [Litorimonas cladophorae]GGX63725.1 acetyltransferase [Litorimonas cladophorae]
MTLVQTSRGIFDIRLSSPGDIPAIAALMKRSIAELQVDVLTPEEIEASHFGMGLDTQLIEDGTYFSVWDKATLVGCGGWSFRATLYGGNHSAGRNAERLNPKKHRARIRAMYTHPDYVRRGIGKMILEASEAAACAAGFSALEMAATLAGEPFYLQCGYTIESRWQDENGPVPVPLLTMVKSLSPK